MYFKLCGRKSSVLRLQIDFTFATETKIYACKAYTSLGRLNFNCKRDDLHLQTLKYNTVISIIMQN
jgi:hypothetical protein